MMIPMHAGPPRTFRRATMAWRYTAEARSSFSMAIAFDCRSWSGAKRTRSHRLEPNRSN